MYTVTATINRQQIAIPCEGYVEAIHVARLIGNAVVTCGDTMPTTIFSTALGNRYAMRSNRLRTWEPKLMVKLRPASSSLVLRMVVWLLAM